MRTLLVVAALIFASTVTAQHTPVFYSYVGDSGRTVYVNRFSLIPPEKRSKARAVDLSQVSLNSELAEELSSAVVKEIQHLKESDPCAKARKESKAGAWRHVWHRHGPWILASLAALILVLLSPWMIRRTPQGVWARFLIVALPALAMTAVLAISAARASSSLEAVSELSKLCDANEEEASPQKRLIRLNEMNTYIDQLYREQYEELERLGEIK
ncbi:MAG: hypothetical protein OEM15_07405 [Myxococcales bacterium]|nr:hypothetical protein [Myxococcales bacterium]MDH3485202.1 hypothetical protein [Myxococcales bacterium]